MAISKKQLITLIAGDTRFNKVHIEHIINSMLGHIESALRDYDSVRIQDFGTFSAKNTAARTGRNPATGEAVEIPDKTKPVFKPSPAMVARFN